MLNFLFPKECLVCSKTGSWLCRICQKKLYTTLPSCYICRKLSNDFKTHRMCCETNSLDSVKTFWKYNECSKSLVHNFKYKNRFKIGDFLFSLFENKLKKFDFTNSLLVPIPSHKKKTLERGFNPTEIISELIAQKVKANIDFNLLSKKETNSSQASLNYEQREENVKDVFEVNSFAISKIKEYNEIVIIDDTITTGSTLNEVCKKIREALEEEINIKGICLFQGSFKQKNEHSKFLQSNKEKEKEV